MTPRVMTRLLLALLSVPVAIAILILFAHEEFMLSVIFHVIALSILLCFRFRRMERMRGFLVTT
jgi:uncharacterized membrane protein